MKYLIMHGSYGSPEENWFRWLEKELKSKGKEVILEQFPVDDWASVEAFGPDEKRSIKRFRPFQCGKSFLQKIFYQ